MLRRNTEIYQVYVLYDLVLITTKIWSPGCFVEVLEYVRFCVYDGS